MKVPMVLLVAASIWAAPPEWAISGKSPTHPPSRWVVGAGSSSETIDLARQAAMADVVRQVKSRIRSTSEDQHWEASSTSSGNSRGETAWSGAQVKASEEIAGIQIAETAQDGKTWYAMAVLERSVFAAPGRAAMREANTDAQKRILAASEAIGKRHPLEALDALRQVEADRSRFLAGRETASLGEPEALQESFVIPPTQTDSLRRVLVRGFELRRGIDSIQMETDKSWPTAAGLGVRFLGQAVTGLEVELSGPNGQILGTARTDTNGFAAPRPSNLPANGTGWARWSLRPRLDLRPAAELGLWVRVAGSNAKIRLDWTGSATPDQKNFIKNRLAGAGWNFDPKGINLGTQLTVTPKGEVQGFSDVLLRFEAKLVLTRGASRCEAVGVGSGSTEAKAIENAIEKLTLPTESLRELLSTR